MEYRLNHGVFYSLSTKFCMKYFIGLMLAASLISCQKKGTDGSTTPETYYFPPNNSDTWETKATPNNWDAAKLQEAFDYAGTKKTYGLIVLHKGRIVKEQYWNGWDKNTRYYIASAGKSVAAMVAGIAQQEGTININNKVSQYLGNGWTSLPLAKENLITVKHQLSMTSGLDDGVADPDCKTPACLVYKADAGNRWAYHNAPYHLLHDVVAAASGQTWNAYCKAKLFDKIGINGAFWLNHVMYCTTRDAARFGSLTLRRGEWNGTQVLTDQNYFNAMTNTAQNMNLSYGYLWWLNGKSSSMAPGSQIVFPVSMAPNAPSDMLMALGKDDKKIYVVPSLDVVVVRLGDDAAGSALGPSSFDNDLWGKLKLAMKY
jgi:CubicO group peptidase (beta-lactamase class C family)